MHPAGAIRFVQGDSDGGGACVAKAVKVDQETVHGKLHAVGNGLDDAHIGLMRDDAREFAGLHSGGVQHVVAGVEHRGNGLLVGFFAVHADRIEPLACVFSSHRIEAGASGDLKDFSELSVAAHVGVADAL